MPRKENIIQDKSEKYSARIIRMYQYLIKIKYETVMSNKYCVAEQASGRM